MTPVMKVQLKNAALRVLHAPGGPLSGSAGRTGSMGAAGSLGKPGVPRQTADGCGQPREHKGAPALEICLIFDGALSREAVRTVGAEVVSALKSADEIFRNVRCNVVFWISDETILHQVTAAAVVQMGRCFEDWEQITGQTAGQQDGKQPEAVAAQKHLELLAADLKKFEARSRLLILITEGSYAVADKEALQQNLNPFLKHRLLIVTENEILRGTQC